MENINPLKLLFSKLGQIRADSLLLFDTFSTLKSELEAEVDSSFSHLIPENDLKLYHSSGSSGPSSGSYWYFNLPGQFRYNPSIFRIE